MNDSVSGRPSLARGPEILAIPGPSVMPERVLSAMHRAAPNIYEGELIELAETLYPRLLNLGGCDGDAVIYIGNGHAGWEASLTNTLSRGDEVLVLVTGRFGRGWADIAEGLGIKVRLLDFGGSRPADPARLQAELAADTSHAIKAVLAVQTDTASSVQNDIPALSEAIRAARHPALFLVDAIASFGCEPMKMQAWGVDVLVAASQKGLMTPPGLAFNLISPRAWVAVETADLKTPYWSWDRRVNGKVFHMKFCGTPPTHHLYGLHEALSMIDEEGLDNLWARHRRLAEAVWAAVGCWSDGGEIALNVPERADRSWVVTGVITAAGDAPRIREWCERQAGVTLGIGLRLDVVTGGYSDAMFRIGHMGHVNPPMLLGTLASIDAALKALGIAHGEGALSAAAAVIARD